MPALLVFAIVGTAPPEEVYARAEPFPGDWRVQAVDVVEPSAIAYHRQRNTYLICSDEGELDEVDTSFDVVARFKLPGDLEGVTVHPDTGTVFVASEREGAVFEFDLEQKRPIRKLVVDFRAHPDFPKGLAFNRGIEGITLIPRDGGWQLAAVVESNPARLVVLSADVSPQATERAREAARDSAKTPPDEAVRVERSLDPGLSHMSDVVYDERSRRLLVPSALTHTLAIATLDGKVERMVRIAGPAPEGVCFAPNGDVIFAQDSGGLIVYEKSRDAFLVSPPADPTSGHP